MVLTTVVLAVVRAVVLASSSSILFDVLFFSNLLTSHDTVS
jgi:hypothetical protein